MPTKAQILAIDRVPTCPAKRCGTCKRPKPIGAFALDPSKPDGRDGRCRQCRRLRYYTYYHEGGGKEAQAEYRDRPDVRERTRRYNAGRKGEKKRESNRAYEATPRGKLVKGRCNARIALRRTTDPDRRAAIEARVLLFDRELARMDAEHELPAKVTRPRDRKCGESPCKGVYLTSAGTFEVRVSVGKSRSVRGGTFATLAEARDAANELAFRLKGIVGYAVPREERKQA